jgi:hypothetical protein
MRDDCFRRKILIEKIGSYDGDEAEEMMMANMSEDIAREIDRQIMRDLLSGAFRIIDNVVHERKDS